MVPLAATRLLRSIIVASMIACICIGGNAAELDGVDIPPTRQVNGKALNLNGYGLRTYSVLGIHIYVVALYLEHVNTNAEEILASQETKLLTVRFERNVSADAARNAWRTGFKNNCLLPCQLDPDDVEKFLSAITAVEAGDDYLFIFSQRSATILSDKHQLGTIDRPHFAEAVLATFLGPKPASQQLKEDLLKRHGR